MTKFARLVTDSVLSREPSARLPRSEPDSPYRWKNAEVIPSPNIWYHPSVYEQENRAQDVGDEIWSVLERNCGWSGRDVLDVGCGDGFHLARFAETARSVIGVEPHAPLVRRARRRVAKVAGIEVRHGAAQRLPLVEASVDLVHARTAYFFGPGCEQGILEAVRVLRRGGQFVVVDIDVDSAPYGTWMEADLPGYDRHGVRQFFVEAGFECHNVETRWWFPNRAELESTLRIEFSSTTAERAVNEVLRRNGVRKEAGPEGLSFPVGYRVHVRTKPTGLVRPHSSSFESSESTSPSIA